MRASSNPDSPLPGDIVVIGLPGQTDRFLVQQLPDQPHISWRTREEALKIARKFAGTHGVDVWMQNGESLERLDS